MTLREILEITRGRLLSGDPNINIDPALISTDTRTLKRGSLFVALKGPNFNGNKFIADAFKKGAVGAIVTIHYPLSTIHKHVVIKVEDGTKALQEIAAYHRSRFKIPVIAVTGSNGKTTVKEMIWICLSAKYNVLKNEGTKNNHIGVSLTLLGLKKGHKICILELGANRKGEIKNLARIVRPTAAVITNIGLSHLEFFNDLEGVFSAKSEIFEYLDSRAFAVVNGDDKYLSKIRKASLKIIKFGLESHNDYRAGAISMAKDRLTFSVNAKEMMELKLIGLHNIYNALAAIAVAREFSMSYEEIRRSLLHFKPSCMRLNLRTINGVHVINDSYNSNPLSMRAALDAVKHYPAHSRWIVSADMLELGKQAIDFHKAVGANIAESGARGLITFGRLSKYTLSEARANGMAVDSLWHCSTHARIADILKRVAKKGDVVLIKGSRTMQMDKVVEILNDKRFRHCEGEARSNLKRLLRRPSASSQ